MSGELGPEMAGELRRFLDIVWQEAQQRHLKKIDIYQIYVGGRPHGVVIDRNPLTSGENYLYNTFFGILKQIKFRNFAGGTGPATQGYGMRSDAQYLEYESCFANYVESFETLPAMKRALGQSFFHFKCAGGSDPTRRIYLNVLPECRANVARFVFEQIVSMVPGVTNAKVAGPLAKGRDTMVIYVCDDMVVNTVLRKLRDYQGVAVANKNGFRKETVHLARVAPDLQGVATAVEPAEHVDNLFVENWNERIARHPTLGRPLSARAIRDIKGNPTHVAEMHYNPKPSFGDFWETLLLAVLAQHPADKMTFFRAVVEKMGRAGLDPLNPHL